MAFISKEEDEISQEGINSDKTEGQSIRHILNKESSEDRGATVLGQQDESKREWNINQGEMN